VTAINDNRHVVCAVKETIDKTTIGQWQIGDKVNLERCMQLNGRLDGHIVQGHVDDTALCIKRTDLDQNWLFQFEIKPQFSHLIIEKGSISINGTSLTCFNVTAQTFEVTIIPYTFEHTSIAQVQEGSLVNIEFDVIGKYIARMKQVEA
jgi:riboflavin synthase